MHRWVPPVLALAAAIAGCGGGSSSSKTTTPRRTTLPPAPAGSAFDGTTSQGQPVRVLQLPAGIELKMRLNLDCRDGSSINGATIDNRDHPVRPKPDGSFYVQETGKTPRTTFPGYLAGSYRWAVSGAVQGASANGSVAFRIQFRDTKCKAVKVTWKARRK